MDRNGTVSRGYEGRQDLEETWRKVFTPAIKTKLAQNDLGTSDSPYRTAISGAILKLQEEGKLHLLKTRWWKEKRGGGSCRVSMQTRSSLLHGMHSIKRIYQIPLECVYFDILPRVSHSNKCEPRQKKKWVDSEKIVKSWPRYYDAPLIYLYYSGWIAATVRRPKFLVQNDPPSLGSGWNDSEWNSLCRLFEEWKKKKKKNLSPYFSLKIVSWRFEK